MLTFKNIHALTNLLYKYVSFHSPHIHVSICTSKWFPIKDTEIPQIHVRENKNTFYIIKHIFIDSYTWIRGLSENHQDISLLLLFLTIHVSELLKIYNLPIWQASCNNKIFCWVLSRLSSALRKYYIFGRKICHYSVQSNELCPRLFQRNKKTVDTCRILMILMANNCIV